MFSNKVIIRLEEILERTHKKTTSNLKLLQEWQNKFSKKYEEREKEIDKKISELEKERDKNKKDTDKKLDEILKKLDVLGKKIESTDKNIREVYNYVGDTKRDITDKIDRTTIELNKNISNVEYKVDSVSSLVGSVENNMKTRFRNVYDGLSNHSKEIKYCYGELDKIRYDLMEARKTISPYDGMMRTIGNTVTDTKASVRNIESTLKSLKKK